MKTDSSKFVDILKKMGYKDVQTNVKFDHQIANVYIPEM